MRRIGLAALVVASSIGAGAASIGAAQARSGGSSGEGDGWLRQELQNPGYVEPSPYAYRDGYRRDDRGAAYEAARRGYPIYGPWGWKYR